MGFSVEKNKVAYRIPLGNPVPIFWYYSYEYVHFRWQFRLLRPSLYWVGPRRKTSFMRCIAVFRERGILTSTPHTPLLLLLLLKKIH